MKPLVYILLLLIHQVVHAGWTLNNRASSFNYFSSKNNNIEVNAFSNMFGTISDRGEMILKIDLSSIDTNNSSKNLLIQDLFLETRVYQEAELSLTLGSEFVDSLDFRKASKISIKGTFMLHGTTQNVELTFLITRLKYNFLLIKTYEPVLLNLTDFGFSDGIAKLRKLEDYKHIKETVLISLNLFFTYSEN